MPFMIDPMACSRTPKCSTSLQGLPGTSWSAGSVGRKLGSPSGVVLLDSARSAEPPHSSGNLGAIAPSTFPEAARVAMPLGSADQLGSASSQPGSARLDQPLVQLLAFGIGRAHLSYACCHSC